MATVNSAHNFKPTVNRLTEFRVNLVVKYIVHCYLLMIEEGKKYNFSQRGKLQKEDYLRNGLVDDYLSKKPYKDYYKQFISDNSNVEIYFNKEENQIYQIDGINSDDYIDISVKETKLSEVLSETTEDEIKLAFECKRIKVPQDRTEYIKDIHKFANRPFTTYRLPFEGQIAFIENPLYTHQTVSFEINKKLQVDTEVKTVKLLKNKAIHSDFDGTYHSIHKRNYHNKEDFSIYHLMLDYSKIII